MSRIWRLITRKCNIANLLIYRKQNYQIWSIQKRYRIYTQDGKGTRIEGQRPLNAETPKVYQEFAAERKKHPVKTFFAPGGNPYQSSSSIIATYLLYFLPVGFIGIGILVLKYLIARRENQETRKGGNDNDNGDD